MLTFRTAKLEKGLKAKVDSSHAGAVSPEAQFLLFEIEILVELEDDAVDLNGGRGSWRYRPLGPPCSGYGRRSSRKLVTVLARIWMMI